MVRSGQGVWVYGFSTAGVDGMAETFGRRPVKPVSPGGGPVKSLASDRQAVPHAKPSVKIRRF